MRWFSWATTGMCHVTTKLSVSHSLLWKINLRLLPDWLLFHRVRSRDCCSYQSSHKQGGWRCVCESCVCLGSMLSQVEKCTISTLRRHRPSGSLPSYNTLTCFISFLFFFSFCKVLCSPWSKSLLCVCVFREWCRTWRSWWCRRVTSHSVQTWTEVSAVS